MDTTELTRVADQFGTPSFVFDVASFQERMRAIRTIWGERVKLCYAMKANPFLVSAAAEAADRLEVCSPGELDICRAVGVDASKIVFSGVNKTAQSVRDAADACVGVMTAESLKHVRLIEAEGARRDQTFDVLLRLNAGSQFGMSLSDLLQVVDTRDELPHLNIVGIHYFVGTQRQKLRRQRKELGQLLELIDTLRDEHGFEVERLEYGPGLAVPIFAGDDFSDTLAPARELAETLQEVAGRVDLTVEMGRFFATECGCYLTSVNDLKRHDDISYCIVDGGINHLTYIGQIMGMKVPVIENLTALRGNRAAEEVEYCICGSLCTTNDVLTRSVSMGELQEGDVLAFHHVGGYSVTEGTYLFLSRTMPRIIIRHADGSLAMGRDFIETSTVCTLGETRGFRGSDS